MKLINFLTLLFLISACSVYAQSEIPRYHTQTDFLLASPGGMGVGLYGYANPALLTYVHQPDLMFTFSDAFGKWHDFNRWGLFAAIPNSGFGMIHEEKASGSVNDYRCSFALGNKMTSFGMGYGWSSGDTQAFNRASLITLGSLVRPIPQLSIGISGIAATSGNAKEGMIDLASRPFGNERLTLFTDYAIQNNETIKDGHWSAGAAVEALPGIRLTARYFDSKAFTVGLNFSLGRVGVASQAHYDESQKYSYNTYRVRIGAYDRNIVKPYLTRKKHYVELDFSVPLKYQRFILFDKANSLLGLISIIERARKDETVGGIAVNASGMRMSWEMAWELREKLKDFKSTGKHVVVFTDGVSITGYHFVSIADKIVLDPIGFITLEGFLLGRTYLKGTLEKLGIGFDEWRFFKYKSAVESLSRERMSEADREQLQKLIDDHYRLAKSDICEARKITPEDFDRLVDEEAFFLAQDALEKGLVDTLGRWDSVTDVVKSLEGKEKTLVNPRSMASFQLPKDSYWGEEPQIAVIYALGVCAMDEGIKARKLVKDVESAKENSKVKAVVLRVDSPGGDAMASDIIAEALRKCKEEKPVIVSQGFVAASGGYWLSMYADTIVAAPNTITGSIGVIGGWVYNKGLKERLGMSTDFVKAGKHADLGFGFRLPFIGLSLPDRNLDEEERAKVEHSVKSLYKEFVGKVASGRKKEYDEIESIAQGRIWSGYDGKENGLVDVLGGLETAIMIAKEKAGIPEDQKVRIVELPKPGLFDLNMFRPKLLGLFGAEYPKDAFVEDAFIKHLRFRLKHNGQPLPILPLEDVGLMMESSY